MTVDRRGFTLVEIIVALAVMLILAATITPSVLGILDKERVENGRAALKHLADGISEFKRDVTKYPSRLSFLSGGITTTDNNSCGARYSAGEVRNYDGPYINRVVQTGAVLNLQIGAARDLLRRVPPTAANAGAAGVLQIVVDNVSLQDAESLNDQVDADGGNRTAGTIRWDPPVNGYVILYYTIGISGC